MSRQIAISLATLDSVCVSFISSREEKLEEIYIDDLSTDDITITVQPSSNLPATPAGRMEQVSDMIKLGLVNQDEARQLLDLPDLDKYQRLATAEMNAFEKIFERILEKGEYSEPVIYTNLELGIRLASKYYCLGISEEVDQENIDMLLQWMNEATELLQPPKLPAPTPLAPVAPPMGPAAPPQTPLPPGVFKPGTKVAPEAVPEGPTLPPGI